MRIIIAKAVCRLHTKLAGYIGLLRARWYGFWWGIKLGRHVKMQGPTMIHSYKLWQIEIGNNVCLNARCANNLVGLVNPTILHTIGEGHIRIGDNCGLSAPVISSRSSVEIGCRCMVGGNVRIFDHDYHSIEAEYRGTAKDEAHVRSCPVVIEDDCFIGTNVIILKGTRIGARSVVAAGSVVFGLDVPQDSLVKGNPALVIKKLKK